MENNNQNQAKKIEVKCPRCKHKFSTKSEILVTCNRCGKKFKRDQNLARPKSQEKLK